MSRSVFDVAQYILECSGPLSPAKLQKLAYFSQAWSLAWEDHPLFFERIEAWASGPTIPVLSHGIPVPGDSTKLTSDEKETINAVLKAYEPLSEFQLMALSAHNPWLDTRTNAGATCAQDRCTAEISLEAIRDYFRTEM